MIRFRSILYQIPENKFLKSSDQDKMIRTVATARKNHGVWTGSENVLMFRRGRKTKPQRKLCLQS